MIDESDMIDPTSGITKEMQNEITVFVRNLFHQRHYYDSSCEVKDTIRIARDKILEMLGRRDIFSPVSVEWQEGAVYVVYVDIGDETFEIYFGGCDDDGCDNKNWRELGIENPVKKRVSF